jgi:hypothetical protein
MGFRERCCSRTEVWRWPRAGDGSTARRLTRVTNYCEFEFAAHLFRRLQDSISDDVPPCIRPARR